MNKLSRVFFFGILLVVFSISWFQVREVLAQSVEQINQEKSKKQAELSKINKEISSIASSKASISSKLSNLRAEKQKLEALTKEMEKDIAFYEEENKRQEEELIALANTYSLQQALYFVESQKSMLVTIFESPNISQVLDRMLYHAVQDKLVEDRASYIKTKIEGLESSKMQIAADKKSIQDSLSSLNQTIAQLEDEQSKLALSLSKSRSQSSALSADIKRLSAEAQAILNKKSSNTAPPTGSGVGAGSGTGVTPPPPVVTPNPAGAVSIIVNGSLLQRTNAVVSVTSSSSELVLRGAQTGEFTGKLEFNKGSGVFAINELSVDKYLWGLAEMPSSWPAEALKVQAVAGRSYAVYRMVNGGYGKFDIYDSVRDQEFVGLGKVKSAYGEQWKNAVTNTSEKVLKHNGTLVQAFYSAETGGHTIASTESPSFGGYRAYLQAKPDRYLDGEIWKPYGNSTVSYWIAGTDTNTMARMEDYINGAIYYDTYGTVKGPTEQTPAALKTFLGAKAVQSKVGVISSVEHVYDTGTATIVENSKYTQTIKIKGNLGEMTVTGKGFKASYNVRSPGKNALWSTLYDIRKNNADSWSMISRGWGHRVGMSQYGAYGRAQAGQTYESILSYYYNGANVVQYSVGRDIRVALEKYGSRVMRVTSPGEITIYEGSQILKKVPANTEIRIEYN